MDVASREGLLDWYSRHARDLPWRRTRDPYAVWVSEVMAQQTQIATVLPYYERWMERFPSVDALAQADEDTVLALWAGLGYYGRARTFLQAARLVARDGWPASADAWRKLPGVGRYTANAIASICLGEAVPVVDGNVKRVYARFCADDGTGPLFERSCWDWAERVLDRERPGQMNQALMELGARVCTPRQPKCGECPLRPSCAAYALGLPTDFPAPAPKAEVVERHVVFWAHFWDGKWGLRRAEPGEWWAGMWCLPTEVLAQPLAEEFSLGRFNHTVTRHRLRCVVAWKAAHDPDLVWFSTEDLETLGIPTAHGKALAITLRALTDASEHDRMAVGRESTA